MSHTRSSGIECRSRQEMKNALRNARSRRLRYAEGYRVLCAACLTAVQQRRARFRYVPDQISR